jgi:hypothetical protein
LFSGNNARAHLHEAIKVAKEIGAKAILADSYFSLGRLNQLEKKPEAARECVDESIKIYKEIGADFSLTIARNALGSIKS